MSEEWINQVTLNCLMNKDQYEKYLTSKIKKQDNKDNKKIFSNRILELTKELLNIENDYNEAESDLVPPDVLFAFENYIKTCIHYFKLVDNNQLFQDQYKDLDDLDEENELKEIPSYKMDESIMVKSIKICNANLDSFLNSPLNKKELEKDFEEEDLNKGKE